MSATGALAIQGFDSQNRRFAHPSPAELAQRIEALGQGDDEFLVVLRAPDFPHDCIQVSRDDDAGLFEVSYRVGDGPWMAADIDESAAVVQLFTDWARETSGWEGDFPWETVEEWELPATPAPAPDAAEAGTALARRNVDEGFFDFDNMVRTIHEMSESVPPLSTEQASALLAPIWRERVIEQRGWGTTDCDRIESAFRELSAEGIVARENFACCQRCGRTEIWDEAEPDDRGYAFYHMQDTESAAAGGGLYLSFGSRSDEQDDNESIGREVVAALSAHGLQTNWDGSATSRIAIADLDWRKRLA